jgi:hypothetical protein
VEAVVVAEDRAGGQVGDSDGFRRRQALGVEDAVHGRGAGRIVAGGATPGGGEASGIGAPALEAGSVAGGERGGLVEDEQLGVPVAPDLPVAAAELGQAADPGAAAPAGGAEAAVGTMKAAATVAHHRAASGDGVERAVGGHAVRERRGSRQGWRPSGSVGCG